MTIRLLFEISKEFFDSMYSHFEVEEIESEYIKRVTTNEEEPIREQPTIEQEEPTRDQEEQDEEKGWSQYEADDNPCYCNGCNIYRNIILFIDPNINDNKTD
jgi:hypothetical protein